MSLPQKLTDVPKEKVGDVVNVILLTEKPIVITAVKEEGKDTWMVAAT